MADLVKQLLQPVAIIWIILILMCAWQIYKRQHRWAAINGGMFLFLFLFGSTTLSSNLIGTLEKPYIDGINDGNATADAVVVLGGYTSGGDEELTGIDARDSFDRILTGVELIREGKADRLFVGGGMYRSNDGRKSEFSVIEPWIKRWDLTDVPIDTLGDSGNTYGESQAVRKLMDKNGWKTILLVTSASHMKRAEAVFLSSGVDVTAVACDFDEWPYRGEWNFFPSTGRLKTIQIWMYESAGWMYYRSKGWIQLDALPER
ncbi:uncharacterized protein METZ01_LOCUS353156 [marine metagenome]|uniref:DUF218 domain-containing protein n=1 Tax=marine metagenome TaxID=408172 RepID=A0A382RSR2_9ZZZZ